MSSQWTYKILVIFRATGLQGSSITEQILSDLKAPSQFSIWAITQDLTKPAAKKLTAKGVDCVAVCHIILTQYFEYRALDIQWLTLVLRSLG